jgi:hypothetical protein
MFTLFFKATLNSKVWHNTRGKIGQTIPLFKDPLQILDYASFWNVPEAIPDYMVQPQSKEVLDQLERGLKAATPRIQRTRTQEVMHIIGEGFVEMLIKLALEC